MAHLTPLSPLHFKNLMKIVAISIVECFLNTFIFVYVHKQIIYKLDLDQIGLVDFFFSVHLMIASCTWGKRLAESKGDCFYIHIMLFIFHSKEDIAVNRVFAVLFVTFLGVRWDEKTLKTFTSRILFRDCYKWQVPHSLLWWNKQMQKHVWTFLSSQGYIRH